MERERRISQKTLMVELESTLITELIPILEKRGFTDERKESVLREVATSDIEGIKEIADRWGINLTLPEKWWELPKNLY